MVNAVLEPVDLSLPSMKELGAKLTGMTEYLAANPQFVVNGFIHSGITHPFDHSDESNFLNHLSQMVMMTVKFMTTR